MGSCAHQAHSAGFISCQNPKLKIGMDCCTARTAPWTAQLHLGKKDGAFVVEGLAGVNGVERVNGVNG